MPGDSSPPLATPASEVSLRSESDETLRLDWIESVRRTRQTTKKLKIEYTFIPTDIWLTICFDVLAVLSSSSQFQRTTLKRATGRYGRCTATQKKRSNRSNRTPLLQTSRRLLLFPLYGNRCIATTFRFIVWFVQHKRYLALSLGYTYGTTSTKSIKIFYKGRVRHSCNSILKQASVITAFIASNRL